jgi:hypothetical protein
MGEMMELLRKIWRLWKRFGQFMGDVLARVVLTLFYFTVFAPFGLGVTFLSDPLRTRRSGSTHLWRSRQSGDQSMHEARRQF